MKDRLKAILADAAMKIAATLRRNKVSAILAVVIVLLLFRSAHIPHISSQDEPKQPAPKSNSGNGRTPAPNIDQALLLEPGEPGADPKLALPANLSDVQVQGFIAQLDAISASLVKLHEAEKHYATQMQRLTDENVTSIMWPRVKGGGFKDKKLPTDWYEIVKDQNGSVLGQAELAGELIEQTTVLSPLELRLPAMRVRAIGGKALLQDVGLLKGYQAYVDERLTYYGKVNSVVDNVVSRMEDEFPVEFGHRQPTLTPEQAFQSAQSDFGPSGFKSLKIGMTVNALSATEFQVLSEDTVYNYQKVDMRGDRWLNIGPYPLDEVRALFSDGSLCNLKVKFSQNGNEIFRLFQQRYHNQIRWEHPPVGGDSKRVTAIAQHPGDDIYAALSGITTGTNDAVAWDQIEFSDPETYRRIANFVR
jgi:hypothetical protein